MSKQAIKIYDKNFGELCAGIKVADCMKNENEYQEDTEQTLIQLQSLSISDSLYCSFCKEQFANIVDQRGHYKLDWHRENLKRKLIGQSSLSKQQFECKKNNGEISSSDDETNTTTVDISKVVKAELKEHESGVDSSESENEEEINEKNEQLILLATKHCQVFFQNENGDLFSIYRCLLHTKKNAPEDDKTLVSLANLWQTNITSAVVLIGGGHFAAAVFRGSAVLVHKTFHCYTVRAGQGGAQSSRDNKGVASKSAGASLRRYNEAALAQHVNDIMAKWKKEMAECNVILYRASGTYNRQVLFGGKAPAMDKTDSRLRTIPFPTKRATYAEVKRVYEIITTVEINNFKFVTREPNLESTTKSNENERKSRPVSPKKCVINRAKSREVVERPLPIEHLSDSDIAIDKDDYVIEDAELDFSHLESFGDSIPKELKQQKKKNKGRRKPKPKVNVKQEDFRKTLFAAVSMQDLELLRCSISAVLEEIKLVGEIVEMDLDKKEEYKWSMADFSTILNEFVSENNNTLLHIAAQSGHEGIIVELLKNGLEPSKKNNDGKTAYCMTYNQDVRNVFKQFRAQNPEKYNYFKSQIPETLSEEASKERAERKKQLNKAKREREKVKRQEKFEKKLEVEEKERYINLSEREKRALAAERRILSNPAAHTTVLSRCFLCGADITGKVPFEYNNDRFCTITCLQAHRKKNPIMY